MGVRRCYPYTCPGSYYVGGYVCRKAVHVIDTCFLTTRNVIETLHDRRLTLTRLPTHLGSPGVGIGALSAAPPLLINPPPPPPPRAAGKSFPDNLDEENPSAQISSVLLVQADEGIPSPIVDLIDGSTATYRVLTVLGLQFLNLPLRPGNGIRIHRCANKYMEVAPVAIGLYLLRVMVG
ncbi:hypothetical protein F511_19414 [Dorcoceras hygrometricum]|uniref:Uncharacterized protein n=1 Tax=Dorcoceras hygrometricum TaxID=472368 RepID=A0A2Z7CV49_9LAMI|nr:hypothetical protein F511_19414 [Dorcoceras hygrometricum]